MSRLFRFTSFGLGYPPEHAHTFRVNLVSGIPADTQYWSPAESQQQARIKSSYSRRESEFSRSVIPLSLFTYEEITAAG